MKSRVAKPKKAGRWRRRLLVAGGSTAIAMGGLWIAIHEIPWLGPMLAEGVRSVVGPEPVAWAEDTAYGIQDWVNLRVRSEEKPKTYWADAPAESAAVHASGETIVAADGKKLDAPPAFDPPFDSVAATGDGVWIPVQAPSDEGPIVMFKSLVHPDAKRPFAAVAAVAIDLRAVQLHLVAGTEEPKSFHVHRADRPGLIPETDRNALLAVFNGGFRAMHGNYGMRIGERSFIPPRDIACTVGFLPDGSLTIRTFSELKAIEPTLKAYRQTPPCLLEEGAQNPGLVHEYNRNWGTTVGGDTIIRRSAIGLSKDGKWLFYALGDAVTAQSLGKAMEVIGAHAAAQLDVNYSYPRLLLAERGQGGLPLLTEPIIPDIKFNPSEYVSTPSQRDFFYLTRKRQAS